MTHKIFFSWQSDTPSEVGRNVLEAALKKAIRQIKQDLEVEEAVREEGVELDKDTKGVAGIPPIVDTIFNKIDVSAVFVADLTFVASRSDGRPSPNPNVLIEYGWALKSLGYSKMLTVMNAAYGEPKSDTMPFDMAHLRFPITYHLSEDAEDEEKKAVQAKLVTIFKRALVTILASEDFTENPPELELFSAILPQVGQGRFRAHHDPLGVASNNFYVGPKQGTPVFLENKPILWFRLMPKAAIKKVFKTRELQETLEQPPYLMPIGSELYHGRTHSLRAEDGCGKYFVAEAEGEHPLADAASYAFHTGELWGIDAYLLYAYGSGTIPIQIEVIFRNALKNYSAFLSNLGLKPPYKWVAGIEGTKGRSLCVLARENNWGVFNTTGLSVSNCIYEEGEFDGTSKLAEALSPFFEKLYDDCNVRRPEWLNKTDL